MFNKRISNLREEMGKRMLDGYITQNPSNIYYLSGYRGDAAYLLITQENLYLYTYPLFKIEAENQTHESVEVKILKNTGFIELLEKDTYNLHSIGIENDIPLYFYNMLHCKLSGKLRQVHNLILLQRTIKDEKELTLIRKAQDITDRVFTYVLNNVKPDKMTELDLAAEMEYQMKKLGTEGYSFKTIVATGDNSAIPHARPGNIKIKKGTNLLMDFGVYYNGYASDMTRTIFIGKATEEFKKVYNIVLNAQKEAENGVQKGKKSKEIDRIARKIIEDAGYGKQFTHGLGHGVGIEVHELPRVNSRSEETLEENMVITIEPGIYLKNKFGVRIEDMVIVKKDSFEIITQSPKELIEI